MIDKESHTRDVINKLKSLFLRCYGDSPDTVVTLPISGSARTYFRLSKNELTAIGAFNEDVLENKAFIYLTKHFLSKGIKVPMFYGASDDQRVYLLEDLGDTTLFSLLDQSQDSESVKQLYHRALHNLYTIQSKGAEGLDFTQCYPVEAFDREAILWDLDYFKYYFLKLAGISFNEAKLQDSFNALSESVLQQKNDFFMFRDFQARNIMYRDGSLYYIDYQGGRKGPLSYDLASLLFNSRANLSQALREEYLLHYMQIAGFDRAEQEVFRKEYHMAALLRVLQALGAYGYRGYFERKKYFLSAIPYGLKNLSWLLENASLDIDPYLQILLNDLTASDYLQEISTNKLTLRIQSFSYKNGLPSDASGNGGGFVFDCRALANPGREEAYQKLSGRDLPVIEFLEQQKEVNAFVDSSVGIVMNSLNAYLERGFSSLSVSYGCTGGQHRSVYCAEQLARRCENLAGVNVVLRHLQLDGPH